MAAEHIKHWRIGEVEVARIVEVNAWEDDITMLLPDATPAFVQQFKWLQPHFATPDGKMILTFQAFVLRSRGKTFMIDTCIGNDHLLDSVDPIVQAGLADFIDPDFQLTDEVSLIPTPGHTPGHVSVLIRSAGQQAIITGDMMHHPIPLAVPATHGRFDMDAERGAQTRVDFVNRYTDTPTLIIGSHFSDPSAGHIIRDGESWQLKT